MKRIEIFLRNILLNFLLAISSSKKKSSQKSDRNVDSNSSLEFSKILFIRLNRIGDALVTTPLLHLIKNNLNPKIYVLCDKKNAVAFQNNDDINEVVIFKKSLHGYLDVLKFIKGNRIDCIVDLHDDVSTTVSFLVALSKVRNKFALEKENKKLYTATIPKLDSRKFHVVERMLELAKLFGINEIDYSDVRIHYQLNEKSINEANTFITENFDIKKLLVGVNISAGSDARFWGIKRFQKLVNFLEESNVNILLLADSKDLDKAKIIAGGQTSSEGASSSKHKLYFSDSFDKFAAMISKIDLLFTPDTMAVHLASAFNKRVFGVYVKYKTEDMIWSPYNVDFDCVVTEEPNLENVTYEQVIAKFKPFLEKS